MKFIEEQCPECLGTGKGQMLFVTINTGERERVCHLCLGEGYLLQPEEG